MLVLGRHIGQKINITGGITITILAIEGSKVSVGVDAPLNVTINRSEIQERIDNDATN